MKLTLSLYMLRHIQGRIAAGEKAFALKMAREYLETGDPLYKALSRQQESLPKAKVKRRIPVLARTQRRKSQTLPRRTLNSWAQVRSAYPDRFAPRLDVIRVNAHMF